MIARWLVYAFLTSPFSLFNPKQMHLRLIIINRKYKISIKSVNFEFLKIISFRMQVSLKQNLYIRKLNGFGEKISVEDSLKIKELKEIVRQLKSLETERLKEKDFNLIFKGKNITENSENTIKELAIPYDGIIHLVFVPHDQKKT